MAVSKEAINLDEGPVAEMATSLRFKDFHV